MSCNIFYNIYFPNFVSAGQLKMDLMHILKTLK